MHIVKLPKPFMLAHFKRNQYHQFKDDPYQQIYNNMHHLQKVRNNSGLGLNFWGTRETILQHYDKKICCDSLLLLLLSYVVKDIQGIFITSNASYPRPSPFNLTITCLQKNIFENCSGFNK